MNAINYLIISYFCAVLFPVDLVTKRERCWRWPEERLLVFSRGFFSETSTVYVSRAQPDTLSKKGIVIFDDNDATGLNNQVIDRSG